MMATMRQQIDEIARCMCVELELDPNAQISFPIEDSQYPAEPAPINPPVRIEWPKENSYYYSPSSHVVTPLMYGPRWQSFRRAAGMHLAGWYAVNKYMLTKA